MMALSGICLDPNPSQKTLSKLNALLQNFLDLRMFIFLFLFFMTNPCKLHKFHIFCFDLVYI